MAIQLLDGGQPSPLHRLIDDYLISCQARGLSPRTDEQYSHALRAVFLRWCDAEDISTLDQLDRRTFDRFTASLLARRNRYGNPISKHAVHSFIRPVRLLLNWASREGETVQARPQLPRREKPLRDVLSRDEIDLLERVMPNERDKLIIRIFGDCGLRLDELTRLQAHDIVRSGRQAHLRVLGKRARVRDVPIPPSLLRRLDRFAEARPEERESDAMFLGSRRRAGVYTPLTDIGVYQVVKDAVRWARITKPAYPHLLRHSWIIEPAGPRLRSRELHDPLGEPIQERVRRTGGHCCGGTDVAGTLLVAARSQPRAGSHSTRLMRDRAASRCRRCSCPSGRFEGGAPLRGLLHQG